jgi:hypothetical protein
MDSRLHQSVEPGGKVGVHAVCSTAAGKIKLPTACIQSFSSQQSRRSPSATLSLSRFRVSSWTAGTYTHDGRNIHEGLPSAITVSKSTPALHVICRGDAAARSFRSPSAGEAFRDRIYDLIIGTTFCRDGGLLRAEFATIFRDA